MLSLLAGRVCGFFIGNRGVLSGRVAGILTILLLTASAAGAACPAGPPPLTGAVGTFAPAQAGSAAPETAFEDAEGGTVRLSDFRGKAVLVNLWATWCAPCVHEMPALDALQAQLGEDGLVVMPVSQDRGGAAAVRPFYGRQGLDHLPIYLDPRGALFRAFGARGLPTSVLIDREGRVVGRIEGDVDWVAPEAVALMRHTLGSCGDGG